MWVNIVSWLVAIAYALVIVFVIACVAYGFVQLIQEVF
jgi:hypothetical protein